MFTFNKSVLKLFKSMHSCIEIYDIVPTAIKSTCYKSMVRLIILCLGPPHCSKHTEARIYIQRTVARFCLNNFSRYSSVTSMLKSVKSLDYPTLQMIKKKAKLIYIIVQNYQWYLHIPSDQLTPSYPHLRRDHYKQLSTRTDSYKF